MDSNSYAQTPNFVELLNSQQDCVFLNSQQPSSSQRRERRTWTLIDDVVHISSWLNTSKDPLVGNKKCSSAFWKRITAYFAASPKVSGCEQREASHCKQRWHKINDLVSKFCGSYEAATREKTSDQNENDILKHSHEIFYNNYKKSSKKRKCEDGAQSASSHATGEADQVTERPPGVKAEKGLDLAMKERLSKMGLLDSLIVKKEPLADYEEALKKKLIKELLSS
ncbi:hypothetical protein N665_1055s0006 [Sinapis alba]|nr:hypothetical protein N665_1055s0006 [Sinapis alba]